MVAGGNGGMLAVVDRRFDCREWPISFQQRYFGRAEGEPLNVPSSSAPMSRE